MCCGPAPIHRTYIHKVNTRLQHAHATNCTQRQHIVQSLWFCIHSSSHCFSSGSSSSTYIHTHKTGRDMRLEKHRMASQLQPSYTHTCTNVHAHTHTHTNTHTKTHTHTHRHTHTHTLYMHSKCTHKTDTQQPWTVIHIIDKGILLKIPSHTHTHT